jgi:hypothetical protein
MVVSDGLGNWIFAVIFTCAPVAPRITMSFLLLSAIFDKFVLNLKRSRVRMYAAEQRLKYGGYSGNNHLYRKLHLFLWIMHQ